MNKEQIEAMIADGKINAACVAFADGVGIPASDLIGFVAKVIEFYSENTPDQEP